MQLVLPAEIGSFIDVWIAIVFNDVGIGDGTSSLDLVPSDFLIIWVKYWICIVGFSYLNWFFRGRLGTNLTKHFLKVNEAIR